METTLWTEHDLERGEHWKLTLAYVASGLNFHDARKQAAIDLAVPTEHQVRDDPSAGRVCLSTAEVPPHRDSTTPLRVRIGWTKQA